MTIVYADDDPDDLQLFREAIKEINSSFNCITVRSGDELLKLLESGIFPDIIFLDINMPAMTGFECLQKLRANMNFNDIQVILLSTAIHPLDDETIKGLKAEFLLKQNTYGDLLKELRKKIGSARLD